MSNTNNESRDYDQLTQSGGKNGVMIRQGPPQQPQNTAGGGTTPSRRILSPTSAHVLRRSPERLARLLPKPLNGTGSNPQPAKQSYMQIDNQGVITHSSKSDDHQVIVDEGNKKVALNVPTQSIVYLGGDGKTGQYSPVVTLNGPSANVMARN